MLYDVIDADEKTIATGLSFDAALEVVGPKSGRRRTRAVLKTRTSGAATTTTAEVFVYRFTEGWATYTLCEETGAFSIHSDWGDYTYMWPPFVRPRSTLKEFLVKADKWYIAMKLSYGQSEAFRRQFDLDATIEEIRKNICRERREGKLGSQYARELWEEIGTAEPGLDERAFYDWLLDGRDSIRSVLGPEVWEYFQYKKSMDYLFMQDSLIPFIQEELKNAHQV